MRGTRNGWPPHAPPAGVPRPHKPGTRREVPSVHSRHLRLTPAYLPHGHTACHRSRIQGEYTVPPIPRPTSLPVWGRWEALQTTHYVIAVYRGGRTAIHTSYFQLHGHLCNIQYKEEEVRARHFLTTTQSCLLRPRCRDPGNILGMSSQSWPFNMSLYTPSRKIYLTMRILYA
jgi:hypothetical protein